MTNVYSDLRSRARLFLHSYGWLVLLSIALTLFCCAYVAAGNPLSATADLIVTATLPFAIALWVVRDARRRRCTPCYDFGFLIYVGWWLTIPGYLIWTRGWRGILVFLMFVALILAPWLAAGILWEAMYGGFN